MLVKRTVSQDHRLEESCLNRARATERNVSAGHARIAVGEDLGLVGAENILGGVAMHVPDVDRLHLGEHYAATESPQNTVSSGTKGVVSLG